MTDPRILAARADVARHWDAVADRTADMERTLRRVAEQFRQPPDDVAEIAACFDHFAATEAHNAAFDAATAAERRLRQTIAMVYRERAQ